MLITGLGMVVTYYMNYKYYEKTITTITMCAFDVLLWGEGEG